MSSPPKNNRRDSDKKSGSGTRGLPKKGGAGGKGTWGKPGQDDLLGEGDATLATDSLLEEEEARIVRDIEREQSTEKVLENEQRLIDIVQEYLTSQDVGEVAKQLADIEEGDVFPEGVPVEREFLYHAIVLAMSRKGRERELVSTLISELMGTMLTSGKVERAFLRLLEDLDDISLDVPSAPDLLGQFLARAQVDEVIVPAFLADLEIDESSNDKGAHAITVARSLLKAKHTTTRLAYQWGQHDAGTISGLKEAMNQLLEEYLDSQDQNEAEKCVKELDAQYFHHELVKQALILGIERKAPDRVMLGKLLAHLNSSGTISDSQVALGFNRVLDRIEDVRLDNPSAYKYFVAFVAEGTRKGFLPLDWLEEEAA